METRSASGGGIKVVIKAAAIIDLLADSEHALSLTEIATQLGIARSTLHGILATLVSVGYLTKETDTGNYRLGLHLFEIGNKISRKLDERKIAKPYMEQLSERTGETVHLAVLEDGEVLYINKQESNSSIRIITESGIKLPAHCTGVGKALLSGLCDERIKEIAKKKGLAKYTETTITGISRLLKDIERIRAQGFAADDQEFMVGLRCVAIPIRNIGGEVVCAISISGPVSRMSGELFEMKKRHLMKAARSISKKLGYGGA
ncbi:MAG: IclR family transcriptional regulator [Clostridiales Family XIII bacterium]|nr:IclR family transcriptional regulator [Clostridiales Family XIII bacterium]